MPTSQVLPRPAAPSTKARPREFFAGLDGLRALAIISVLVFHLHDGWLPGGFLGVDVFFVISGFLITSLLAREIADNGIIDLKGFWTRRARRLIPALVLCVVGGTLLARLVSADLTVGIGRQVLGAATFSTNWVEIISGQSYFDQTAPTLFMNLWSLAVEEQFYLVWPIVSFVLLVRLHRNARWAVPLAVATASTLAMALLYVPGEDVTRLYYGTDTHLMGLMLGATLAFLWAGAQRAPLEVFLLRHRHWVGPVALAVVAVGMVVLTEASALTYRGGFTVVSAATGVLVLSAITRGGGPRTPLQYVLDGKVVTWIGRRSYGLYLWHWPAIVIIDQLWPAAVDSWQFLASRALAVALTVGVAELSFRFVEEPIRKAGFHETGRRVRGWVRALPWSRARGLVAASLLLGLALTTVVATAPSMTETARVLQANAQEAQVPDAPVAPAVPVEPAVAEVAAGPAPAAEVAPAASEPAGGKPSAVGQDWSMPTGDEIDGFGDSMMVSSVHALRLYFPGIRIDAESNRRWAAGQAAIEARGEDARRAVVVHFGLNAGTKPEDVTAVLDALGPDRMVVLVNLYGTFARVETDNAALSQAVAGRDNVAIADWQQVVRDDPRAVQSDRKHPSLRGSHLYARAVQSAFAELVERHTGVAPELVEHQLP